MERVATYVHVLLLDFTSSIFDNNEWSADTSSIRSDVNRLLLQVDVDTDELVDPSRSTKLTESANESRSTSSKTKNVTVEVDDQVTFGIDFSSIENVDVCGTSTSSQSVRASGRLRGRYRLTLDTDQETDIPNRFFFDIGRDVSHECQILDQSTSFSFRCITRTQHSTLRWLKSTRSRNFPRLFELRRNTSHHS